MLLEDQDQAEVGQIQALLSQGFGAGEVAKSLDVPENRVALVQAEEMITSPGELRDDQKQQITNLLFGLALTAADQGTQARVAMYLHSKFSVSADTRARIKADNARGPANFVVIAQNIQRANELTRSYES